MSKRTPESRDELLAARVLHESEWAYRGWLAHKSAAQMRVEANRPPSDGGLGYDLSVSAIRGLIEKGRELHGEAPQSRDAMIERELQDLDLVQTEAARAIVEQRQSPPVDAQGNIKPFAGDAAKLYLEVGDRRRKLLGLDAAQRSELEVVHRDAVMEELDAALARLDSAPKEKTR